eukprot:CAMPEP_0113688544 /NCGR_PEP_ID=MMETSP0038_2-20120614/16599_1 /TAXON_ID=2898 /ORGANISM="Cryptomonas paramecium" /LENGTH=373 /DNA_ID=CAMNT_0000609379 /DNA_START=145 /DNA_END=1263 /DNA_ORIENTATION=+ /assembly_acc=CAM_ASM_000170
MEGGANEAILSFLDSIATSSDEEHDQDVQRDKVGRVSKKTMHKMITPKVGMIRSNNYGISVPIVKESSTDTNEIDLASIRAVAKGEACGASLAGCLDEELPQISAQKLSTPLDGIVLENALSDQECEKLIAATEALGYSFWHPTSERRDFRNADTIEVTSEALAQRLWARVREQLPGRVAIEREAGGVPNPRWSPELEGVWRPTGLNPCFLFNRYGSGGHFSPHTDGYSIVDFNTRSLYSALFYLSPCQGGETRMMEESGEVLVRHQQERFVRDEGGRCRFPDERVRDEVQPAPGRALFFFQDTLHEGAPVRGGTKYMIRSDVMYTRDPPLCDQPADREAYGLFREAELLEAEGQVERATALFRRVSKLSPSL